MTTDALTCPKCQTEIPLTEAISIQLKASAKKEVQAENAKLREEFALKQKELLEKEQTLATAKSQLEEQVNERLNAKRLEILREAQKKAELELGVKNTALQEQVFEQKKKLDESRQSELNLMKRQRELEEKQTSMELENERKLQFEREKISETARSKAAEQYQQKILEKEKLNQDLTKALDEMKRKMEQGSQQTQGEVVELELENMLRTNFPYDQIEPVAKGVQGADVVQRINNKSGQFCGTIIWESKQTKAWSDGWIDKLKEDQRAMKAEFAILLTAALPKDIKVFGNVNGVWVTTASCMISVVNILRQNLIQISFAKMSATGKQEKMDALYNYLLGTEFKQRVEAIVDTSLAMKNQLQKEKIAFTKIWSEREKQIDQVVTNMVGIHGDLKGLGASMPAVKSIELDAIVSPKRQQSTFPLLDEEVPF